MERRAHDYYSTGIMSREEFEGWALENGWVRLGERGWRMADGAGGVEVLEQYYLTPQGNIPLIRFEDGRLYCVRRE